MPTGGPILIITDGTCDVLRVRRDHAYLIPARDHAYLIPARASLPFTPRGPVFRVR